MSPSWRCSVSAPLPAPAVVLRTAQLRVRALAWLRRGPVVGEALVAEQRDRRLDAGVEATRVLALGRRIGRPNTPWSCPASGRFMPLPKIGPVPSMNIGTTGAPVRAERYAGTALELLAPAVGRASAFGIDQQAPSVRHQVADLVGRLAARRLTVDRQRVERQRGGTALRRVVKK